MRYLERDLEMYVIALEVMRWILLMTFVVYIPQELFTPTKASLSSDEVLYI